MSAAFALALVTGLVFSQTARAQLGPGKPYLSNRLVSSIEAETHERVLNNWLDFGYRYRNWTAGGRFEIHEPRNAQVFNNNLTQRFLEFRRDWLRLRAGNFYERLGRGLVFHAFEIQSQSLNGIEQSLAVDRNIDGVNVKLSFDKLEATGIWGRPLKTLSSERGDPLAGGEINFRPARALVLGGAFLRMNTENFRGEAFHFDMSSAQLGINFRDVDLHAELARKQSSNTISEPEGNAVFLNANYSGASFGLSAEFKRYENFSTIFNNPPALVKTHSFALLNRHTHSLNANNETGYLFEGYFSPNAKTTLTLHAAGADNLQRSTRRRFREYFVETRSEWSGKLTSRVLLDYSRDRPVGDLSRWALAFENEHRLSEKNSVILDGQFQRVENENSGTYRNLLGLLSFSRSPWLTLSAQREHTTNRFSPRRDWLAAIINLKIGPAHDFYLTLGSRPAGLVCSGGICFQTPEFEGLELRWNMRY
jgi:hypothetical protein